MVTSLMLMFILCHNSKTVKFCPLIALECCYKASISVCVCVCVCVSVSVLDELGAATCVRKEYCTVCLCG